MNATLQHYGVKGMKWGVRWYQNPDGTLTDKGRKRISKKFEKLSKKIQKDADEAGRKSWLDIYNNTAREANERMNDFNEKQRKKYGENFANRPQYESDYRKHYDKIYSKHHYKKAVEFLENNKNNKKATELINQYKMLEWNETAKQLHSESNELRKMYKKYKDY